MAYRPTDHYILVTIRIVPDHNSDPGRTASVTMILL